LSLSAISVSRSIRQGLGAASLQLRVLGLYENACNLVATDGRVFALVSPNVGDGPLNIVVDAHLPHLPLPPAGAPASINAARLCLGEIEIGLACADWESLRARYPLMRSRGPTLVWLARQLAPSRGLLALMEPDQPATPDVSRLLGAVRQALMDLPPGQIWAPSQVDLVAFRTAGRGWGLTPSGDDWLAGLLTWAWLGHPHAQEVGSAVVRAAAPRTATLSAAFLRSAAQGECDMAWQTLLTTATSRRLSGLDTAMSAVLSHGETSGADRLAGFLYGLGPFAK
jgi:hypothetical protein